MQPKLWNPSTRFGAALTIVAALYLLVVNVRELGYQNEHGPALIAELQQRITPTPQLISLEPDMSTAEWSATWRSANCTFSNPTIDNCWDVHFMAWVPGVPGMMAGRRQVEASWIVDADTMVFSGNSRFFRRRE